MEEQTPQDETELELHPENIRTRQDTYSSLTDLYQIDLFTEEFQAVENQVALREHAKTNKLENNIFIKKVAVEEDAYEQLASQLFGGTGVTQLLPSYTEESQQISWINIGMLLLSVFLVIGIYTVFEIKGKEKAGHGHNNSRKK